MNYLSQIFPMANEPPLEQADKLIEFLLHHFSDELKQYESYKEINSPGSYQMSECVTRNLWYDIELIMSNMNMIIQDIQELDGRTANYTNFDGRLNMLTNDVFAMQNNMNSILKRLDALEQQISENTQNKKDSDK